MTLVGEPQNLVIARYLEWDFVQFGAKMLPVSSIVLPLGLITCLILESSATFSYGVEMPPHVRKVLKQFAQVSERLAPFNVRTTLSSSSPSYPLLHFLSTRRRPHYRRHQIFRHWWLEMRATRDKRHGILASLRRDGSE